MSEHASLPLAAEFPPATEEQWLAAVRRVLLKGQPDAGDPAGDTAFAEAFERRLVDHTADGIAIGPLFSAAKAPPPAPAPGTAPYVRGTHPAPKPWEIRQRVWPDVDGSRAVTELESGATAVLVELPAADAAPLARALAGVHLEMASVSLAGPVGDDGVAAGHLLVDRWQAEGTAPGARAGTLGADPIGAWARTGGAGDLTAGLKSLADLVTRLAEHPAAVRAFVADGTVWHDAGATPVQELAWNVAAAATYVRALADAGVATPDACSRLELRWAADADQFTTIAKLRAARLLWARVAELAGLPPEQRTSFHHVEGSRAMLTRYDTWTNALRSTVACFGAAVGGADSVTIWPHDALVAKGGSALGRRIARNTQTIIQSESNLWRVLDPAGGSWYTEQLTDELAAAAWAELRRVEARGGLVAAVEGGHLHRALDEVLSARAIRLATRRQPLTGLSEFPDIAEQPPPPAPDTVPAGAVFEPFVLQRLSAGFEAQRGRADAHTRSTGQRPTVYLATLGTPAQFTARATFAKNLFEAAGINTVTGPAGGLAGTTVACLCSSDAVYAEHGAAAVAELRAAGATRVYVAGRRLNLEGVDEEVGVGSDMLDVLTRTLDTLLATTGAQR